MWQHVTDITFSVFHIKISSTKIKKKIRSVLGHAAKVFSTRDTKARTNIYWQILEDNHNRCNGNCNVVTMCGVRMCAWFGQIHLTKVILRIFSKWLLFQDRVNTSVAKRHIRVVLIRAKCVILGMVCTYKLVAPSTLPSFTDKIL